MACNCATQEQLNELYRKYGRKVEPEGKTLLSFRLKNAVNYSFIGVALIFVIPFLFIFVLWKGLFAKEKKISLRKFFRLKANSKFEKALDSEFLTKLQDDVRD